jgi:hypothetical protein
MRDRTPFLNAGPKQGIHGEYLAAKGDLDRLNRILEETNKRYEGALAAAEHLSLLTKITDCLFLVISFGIARPPDRKTEIENKKRTIHQIYCPLIDKILKEISQLSLDFSQISEFERQYTANIKYGISRGGYPPNWEEISKEVRERDGYRCTHPGCGETGLTLHVHHVIPLSRGGSNALSNLLTLCEKHHASKHMHMRR